MKTKEDPPNDSERDSASHPRLVRLGCPHCDNCADEARELGLKVGDVIRGKEGGRGLVERGETHAPVDRGFRVRLEKAVAKQGGAVRWMA